jgi:hypothetical protein
MLDFFRRQAPLRPVQQIVEVDWGHGLVTGEATCSAVWPPTPSFPSL